MLNVDNEIVPGIHQHGKRSWIGFICAVLSAACTSVGTFFVKLTEGERMQVVVIYCIVLYLVIWPFMTYKKVGITGDKTKRTVLLVLRGAFGAGAISCDTISLNYLSLGDSQAIVYTSPVLVGIFACICLNERCSILNAIFTIATFSGLILVAQPSFLFGESDDQQSGSLRMIGIIFSLFCTLFLSIVCVIIRHLGTFIHFSQALFYFSTEALLVSIFYLLISGRLFLPCAKDLPSMTGGAAFLALGQMFMTIALQYAKAGPVTLLLSIQVVFAFILQYLAFGMIPSLYSAIGAGLIFACSVGVSLKGMYKLKTQT